MSKKKNEKTTELNDAALEATSGGTVMYRIKEIADGAFDREWAAAMPDGQMREGLTMEDALAFNSGKADSKIVKNMKNEGWRKVKFE